MKHTSLHAEHLELGAKMGPFAGYDMPLQYSGVKNEVLAVRHNAGMFDVSHMGEFWVKGADATRFVDELVTNDFAGAAIGKAVYSPLCRDDGTVIDDLIAYKLASDNILICVNASNIAKDWEWIAARAKNYNIALTDHSEETSLIAVQGPKTVEFLAQLKLTTDAATYAVATSDSLFGKVIIARTGYTGEDGFEIFCDHAQAKKIWRALNEMGVTPCGLAARDVLRLEACYPLYGHELSDEWTPLDAGLKWTVKDAKPQFVGKQALTDYQPRFKLMKLILDRGIPRDGYPVKNLQGDVIGHVTSGTMSVMLGKGVALALIETKHAPKFEETVNVSIRNQDYAAKVVKDAFLKGVQK